MVRIARLRRRIPENIGPSVDSVSGILCSHISHSVRLVPSVVAGIRPRLADRQHNLHRGATVQAASRAHPGLHGALGFARRRPDNRYQQHDGVANVCPVLVCAAHDRRRAGSNLQQADQLLSVHTSRVAVRCGLAGDPVCDCLSIRRFLCFCHRQHPDAGGGPRQIHLIAVARILPRVWFLTAHGRDAHLYWPVRAIIGQSYDF